MFKFVGESQLSKFYFLKLFSRGMKKSIILYYYMQVD